MRGPGRRLPVGPGCAAALNDDLGFLSGQGCAARSLAAAIWARHPFPPHLGARLATDLDPRVRRALAEGLPKVDPASEQMDVRLECVVFLGLVEFFFP